VSPAVQTGGAGQYVNSPAPGQAPTQPTGGFNSAIANMLTGQGWNPQAAIGGYAAGAAAPGIAQAGLQSAQALQQAGLVAPAMALGAANLESQTGYSIANALLSEQGIGLESQGLATQAGTAAQQQQLEQQQFGVQQTAVPEQLAEAQQQYGTAMQAQQGAAGAAGATNTVGNKTAQSNLTAQYGWNTADIYRSSILSQLGQQSEQVGYGGQQAQLANQQQQLQLAAQGAGIPVQQAESQLQYGLGQLGITGEGALSQAIGQASTAQGQGAGDYAALLSLVGATTGMGPSALLGGG
jgi:hypothetical protein